MHDPALGAQIECRLATLTPPSIPAIRFASADNPIALKIIATGKYLRELLSQFSHTTKLTIEADPEAPTVVLTCDEHWGSVRMAISGESPHLEGCHCTEAVHTSFPAAFVKSSSRILNVSSKASLRVNRLGAVSLQIMIPQATETCFFEYVLAPYIIDP